MDGVVRALVPLHSDDDRFTRPYRTRCRWARDRPGRASRGHGAAAVTGRTGRCHHRGLSAPFAERERCQARRCIVCSLQPPSRGWRHSITERSACRSLRVHRRHTPNGRDSISRSFTPIRRSVGILRHRPTCNASSPSPRRAFTKCYSFWSAADSFAALRDVPDLSKCSSLPRTFRSCDDRSKFNRPSSLCRGTSPAGARRGPPGRTRCRGPGDPARAHSRPLRSAALP